MEPRFLLSGDTIFLCQLQRFQVHSIMTSALMFKTLLQHLMTMLIIH
ncbi:MAG TPA: hypothetical protein DEB71_04125 [Chryseobacterium carnipullorum]|nr:hypothetical protein [Chryseobacterium carnipullorum]